MNLSEFGLEITVYDVAWTRVGWITDPLYLTLTPRLNGPGTGEVELRLDDALADEVIKPGTRFRVVFRGEHLMSGHLTTPTGPVIPGERGGLIVQFTGYWQYVVQGTLGWVQPRVTPYSSGKLAPESLSDDAQMFNVEEIPAGTVGGADGYVFPDGSAIFGGNLVDTAESAVKDLIRVNGLIRLGRPLTIEPDQGRGGDARAARRLPRVRMIPLDEALAPLLEWSGLSVLLEHREGEQTVRVDVRASETLPEITPETGAIGGGSWQLEEPGATRIVVGGPGESVARAYYGVNDTTGLEQEFGEIIEVFRDATGGRMIWPNTVADSLQNALYYLLRPEVAASDKTTFENALKDAGAKGLEEGLPTSGMSLNILETPTFRFHGTGGFHLGDILPVRVGELVFENPLTSATISLTADDGLTVRPVVGKREDDVEAEFADAISRLASAVRRLASDR